MNINMDANQASPSYQGVPSNQAVPSKKQTFIFPLNMIVAIIISLILGLGMGIFAGQMIKGSLLKPSSVSNAVFTAEPSYVAPVEGTLAAKGENKITLENKGAKLDIEVAMTAPALIQEGSAGQVSTKTIGDVEVGSILKGSVVVSPEFMAGDKNGKVTGSAFFVTKK